MALNHSQPQPIEANEADTDTDTDTDYEYDNEIVIDKEKEKDRTSTELMPSPSNEQNKKHWDYNSIHEMAQAVEGEATDDEWYPYDHDLVDKFYEINEERGWIYENGEEIVNVVPWYKGFMNTVLENGYRLKDVRCM